MRIAFHVGAHFTDEERLLKSLLKDRGLFAQHGIAVPGPKRYRNPMRDAVIALKGRASDPAGEAALLNEIIEGDMPERLVLSWDSFLALPPWALKGRFYPSAAERANGLMRMLPSHECEFYLALRNPATFLPVLFQTLKTVDMRELMAGVDPFDLCWSELIERLLNDCPGINLTVWSDEDTPLIWPEVLRSVSGYDGNEMLAGDGDLLNTLLSGEGLTRLNTYLISHPPASPLQRRKIVSAFLDKFALPDRVNASFEMPGWSQSMVEEMTQNYEEDLARLAYSGDVTFIQA